MKQKLFTLLLAVVASVGTMFAWDYERVQIGNLYYNLDATSQTAEVTSQNSSNPYWSTTITTAIIPASVEYNSVTYSVTSIGDLAFRGCTSLTSVTIPNSVTSIGHGAFYECSGLTSPVYNAHLFAFMPTSYSGAYTIPDGIESIAGTAFSGCTSLTSVTIPNSVTSIGDYAFDGCSGLTSVTIPNSVTSIGNDAFAFCTGLATVTIPNSVTSIGDLAFRDCTGLTSVTIPNSVTSIGDYAFYCCSGLTSVIVENGNSFYDSRNNCNAIIETATNTLIVGCMNTIIPNSVTSIGNDAFAFCTGLATVTIGNSVTSIGDYAFYECTDLTSITCEAITPPTLGSYVFHDVNKSIPLYVPAGSVDAYKAADQWKDFTNIIGIAGPVETQEKNINVIYEDIDEAELYAEKITFNVPVAPVIEGFTFVKWIASSDNIEDGITIQAVYQADIPSSAPEVYTNPSNPAQKLIRNGNVYILTDDSRTYTITGQQVK